MPWANYPARNGVGKEISAASDLPDGRGSPFAIRSTPRRAGRPRDIPGQSFYSLEAAAREGVPARDILTDTPGWWVGFTSQQDGGAQYILRRLVRQNSKSGSLPKAGEIHIDRCFGGRRDAG